MMTDVGCPNRHVDNTHSGLGRLPCQPCDGGPVGLEQPGLDVSTVYRDQRGFVVGRRILLEMFTSRDRRPRRSGGGTDRTIERLLHRSGGVPAVH